MNMRGFSLLELTLIIVMTSILGVIAAISMPPVAFYRTQSFAGVFLNDLNLTKSLSISENQRYRIVIGTSSYQIQDQNGVVIDHPETGLSATTYANGVTVTPTQTLIFDALGQPYDGSGTALSTTLTFTVADQGINYTVSVSPQTGFVQ